MPIITLSNEIEAYDLTSCMVHCHGELIYHYEKFNQASSQLMPINSCTKSVLSALICIAMEHGLIAPPDTLISHYFPQLRFEEDERKKNITLTHLLTLTAGFQWNEFSGINSFPAMTKSADWIQYVLDQPMSDAPGSKMVYNSGVSQLLAAILVQASGMEITRFAERHLFTPLEIEQYYWRSDTQGIHTGGFGLQLTAMDTLKFGLLYLHKGVWNNQQLIRPSRIEDSTSPAIAATPPERGSYGWHWWVDDVAVATKYAPTGYKDLRYYYARGYGGQFIFIVPSLESVVILTRKYRKKGMNPYHLFRQYIAPILMNH